MLRRHSLAVVVTAVSLFTLVALPAVAQDLASAFKASYAAEAAGNYDEAWRVMNEALGRNRTSYPGVMRLAYIRGIQLKYDEAAQLYAAAAALEPRAVEPLVYLQYQYLLLQNWSKLEESARAALVLDPNHYASRTRLAWSLYSQQRYAESAAEYTKVSQLYPLDIDVLVMRGWAFALSGRRPQAEMVFDRVLEVAPENASAIEGKAFLARLR